MQPGFARPEEVQTLRISIPEHAGEGSCRCRPHAAGDHGQDRRHPRRVVGRLSLDHPDDRAGLARSDLCRGPSRTRSRRFRRSARFKFVSPGLLKTMGNSARRRPRSHLDRSLREAAASPMVSENLARELWRDPSAAIGKRIRENLKAAVARSRRRRQRRARRRREREGADDRAMADPDGATSTDDETFVQRSPAYMIRSSRTGIERFHRRGQPGRLVREPEPAAGERPHAAGGLRQVAGADVVHAGDAGDRRRDGAAARHCRHLRRHLLLGVAAHARNRHPHRAGRAATTP